MGDAPGIDFSWETVAPSDPLGKATIAWQALQRQGMGSPEARAAVARALNIEEEDGDLQGLGGRDVRQAGSGGSKGLRRRQQLQRERQEAAGQQGPGVQPSGSQGQGQSGSRGFGDAGSGAAGAAGLKQQGRKAGSKSSSGGGFMSGGAKRRLQERFGRSGSPGGGEQGSR